MGGAPSEPSILNTSLQTLSAGSVSIGLGSGSPGTLNVVGGAFQITGTTSDDELIVGDGGSGSTLNVTNGADLNVTGQLGNVVLGKNAGVTGTANVSGAGSLWNQSSDDVAASLSVGGFGVGAFNITGGGQAMDYRGILAAETGSSGSATVNGNGSKWINREQLVVGLNGTATLTISGGGQVIDELSTIGSKPNSSGIVNVLGAGSEWKQATDLRVGGGGISLNGQSGAGAMHISAGGKVQTGGDGYVSYPGTGTVSIDGSGSLWNVAGNLSVDDDGSISLTGGGQLMTNTALDSGSVNVSGVGSAWIAGDYLSISNFALFGAAGVLNVSAGGRVAGRQVFVGGNGEADIIGMGSELVSEEQLFVGLNSGGAMRISGGAHVRNGTGQMGVSLGSIGMVSISGPGSQWINSGDLYVGVAGTARLTVTSGGVASAGGLLSVGANGVVEGDSTVAADVHNGGTVSPGVSTISEIGTLHVSGDYTQTAAGDLDLQLASLASFDKLSINGHATLGGTLSGAAFNGYSPTVGDTFQILTATEGITGAFAALDFPMLISGVNGPRWVAIYSNSDVILKFVDPQIGDYNRNGVVDAGDYVVWRNSLGQSVAHGAGADGSDNGVIDAADYAVWKAHFGETLGSSGVASDSAVPEPSSWRSFVVGVGILCLAFGRDSR